jgi:hypothetical protein
MKLKITHGTAGPRASLCETCQHVHKLEGFREAEELVICNFTYPSHPVPFAVRTCTDYAEKARASLREMQKIAWTISVDGAKQKAGFAPSGASGVSAARAEPEEFVPWE